MDIVARDGNTLVFVEVKARTSLLFGRPAEAVTWRKQRKLQVMAQEFLARSRLWRVPCRFDVVAILVGEPGAPPRVEVFRSGFDAGSHSAGPSH